MGRKKKKKKIRGEEEKSKEDVEANEDKREKVGDSIVEETKLKGKGKKKKKSRKSERGEKERELTNSASIAADEDATMPAGTEEPMIVDAEGEPSVQRVDDTKVVSEGGPNVEGAVKKKKNKAKEANTRKMRRRRKRKERKSRRMRK